MTSPHTYKVIELVGSSPEGVQPAIEGAIAKAGETIRNLDWFVVKEIRGNIKDGVIEHYQVTLGIGFRILDSADLHKE
ncbi:MAG: dodecin domain-containing protein [Chloroflexi bacterium]|nr:dodecin domain-containing protein [Chloroflexota bacterium]